jgi:small subunit ribosomal protein S4
MNGKKIDSPSYVVKRGEEDSIGFYPSSPVAKQIEKFKSRNSGEKTE